jgi:hypothetical protein
MLIHLRISPFPWSRFVVTLAIAGSVACWQPSPLFASQRIDISCDAHGCAPENIELPRNLVWAPGSRLERTLVIRNTSNDPLSVKAAWDVSGAIPTDVMLEWLNGSHRILWKGVVGDGSATLGTVPRHGSRLFTMRVELPRDVSATETRPFTFSPSLVVSSAMTPSIDAHHSSLSTLNPLDAGPGATLGAAYRLPELSEVPAKLNALASQTHQLFREVRTHAWLPWLIVLLEALSLEPWSGVRGSYVRIGAIAAASAAAVWLASGSWLMSATTVIIATVWASIIFLNDLHGARP